MQEWLGLGGGLVVAGMGAWLLLARLSGRADHVHLFGGHHHHHTTATGMGMGTAATIMTSTGTLTPSPKAAAGGGSRSSV